ncbi:MAG: hypothetical protein HYR77_01475 [Ignavibacteria bacterium]|nr:hypothetical protein [Ignavibacteria bacterium]
MKKIQLLAAGFLVLLSLIVPQIGHAQCAQHAALDACYADCKSLFSTETLRTACYGGCLIGCAISSAS